MVSSKRLGLAIMVAAPATMIAYGLGIVTYRELVEQMTAVAFMMSLLGVMSWIGYTMFTEPISSRPVSSQSDIQNFEPETINGPTLGAQPLQQNQHQVVALKRSAFSVVTDCSIGEGTVIRDQVNLFKCKIGRDCKIESFVYVEEGVIIGNRCKIKPNVFIPTGVTIGDNVFIGPNVTFTNDKHPIVTDDWEILPTLVGNGASIGAHAVILPGVKIGENAVVGAGAVVTKDIPAHAIAVGNPARVLAKTTVREKLLQ